MSESRTVAFFKFYDPSGMQINFTIRGGTPLADVGEDLATVRDVLASLPEYGFTPLYIDPESGEFADVRDGSFWVRALSRNRHDVVYVYADHPRVVNKVVTCYAEMIQMLPISQSEWDAAKVWEIPQAPTKDAALAGGYLNNFPGEVQFGMQDTGNTFTLPDGRTVPVLKPVKVLNAAPGGVDLGAAQPQQAQPQQSQPQQAQPQQAQPQQAQPQQAQQPKQTPRPANGRKLIINNGPQCPHCHAPTGKPHASGCPVASTESALGAGAQDAPLPPPRTKKHAKSKRQLLTAQIAMLGAALYGDEWDSVRADMSRKYGVESGSLKDASEKILASMVDALRGVMGEAIVTYAQALGLKEHNLFAALRKAGYNSEWNGELDTLSVKYLVALFDFINASIDDEE